MKQLLSFKRRIPGLCCVVLLSFFCFLSVGLSAEKSLSLSAHVSEMPMLRQWLGAVTNKQTPYAIGKVRLLTEKPLPGIDWRNDSVDEMNAKFYEGGKSVLATLNYEPAYSSKSRDMIFYRNPQGLYHQQWDWQRGQLFLIENDESPVGYIRPPMKQGDWDLFKFPPSTPVSFEQKDDGIMISSSPAIQINDAFKNQYDRVERNKKNNPTDENEEGVLEQAILDRMSGKIIMPAVRDLDDAGTDARKIGDKLLVGAIRLIEPLEDHSFFWYESPLDKPQWTTTKRPIDDNYLKPVLPASLSGLRRLAEQDKPNPKLWKDGSIIFRMEGILWQKGAQDGLRGVFLIMQPRQGTPRLLAWVIQHSYGSMFEGESDSFAARQESAAGEAFLHIWYPDQTGKVVSRYATNWGNELIFDIDPLHNAVIYLLDGRLWAIDLPDASTPAKP